MPDRHARLHTAPSAPSVEIADPRTPTQKDRDRILYTSAFRRLAGVTQVVSAIEGHVFHNRLTHTLEVAQIARRMAEHLAARYAVELNEASVAVDPEVTDAAAMAHDLGHPPFGHIAEEELDDCVRDANNTEGYEGNAQSFRILNRLAAQKAPYRGLNLTRATLCAVMKYPWFRNDGPDNKPKKFGAYRTERAAFDFAREGYGVHQRSLEAQIMDHADSVAYSVHDLDDFYRAGLVPLEEMHLSFSDEFNRFRQAGKVTLGVADKNADKLEEWFKLFPKGRYTGEYKQRTSLRALNSKLIEEFVSEVVCDFSDGAVHLRIAEEREVQMRFLQHLVWSHVIMNPNLATQQRGQKNIVRTLFNMYIDALKNPHEAQRIIPGAFRIELQFLDDAPGSGAPDREARVARLAADIVASFTDLQAAQVYRRVTGIAAGAITDLLDG